MGKSPRYMNSTQRSTSNGIKQKSEEIVLPKEQYTYLLFSAKQSALKTYI